MLASRNIFGKREQVTMDHAFGLPDILAGLQLPENIEGVHLRNRDSKDGKEHYTEEKDAQIFDCAKNHFDAFYPDMLKVIIT